MHDRHRQIATLVDEPNPYRSPNLTANQAEQKTPTDSRSNLFRWLPSLPVIGLAGMETGHFLIALFAWSLGVYIGIKSPFSGWQWIAFLSGAFPAMLLLPLSVFALYLAIRQKRRAVLIALAVLLMCGLSFWFDVANKRWQIQTGVASARYWDEGGIECFYFNWWWYNDGAFRRR